MMKSKQEDALSFLVAIPTGSSETNSIHFWKCTLQKQMNTGAKSKQTGFHLTDSAPVLCWNLSTHLFAVPLATWTPEGSNLYLLQ